MVAIRRDRVAFAFRLLAVHVEAKPPPVMPLTRSPKPARDFDRAALLLHATDNVAVLKKRVNARDVLVRGACAMRAARATLLYHLIEQDIHLNAGTILDET